jgi:2-polyprenyl-3-methyl-5-hydroxy-6-metoxy-1,4-benzoquinol methylase
MDLKEAKVNEEVNNNRHPWEIARVEVIFHLLKTIHPDLINKKATVLDVGCGDMFLIEQLSFKMPKWEFIAVDSAFDEKTLKRYESKFNGTNLKAFNSLEQANSRAKENIDIVLLLDVIEHIKDDVSFLKNVKGLSKTTEKTIYLITVPAFQFLFSSHDVFLEHYRRYDNKLLKKHIEAAGLSLIKANYFFFSLLPLRFIKGLTEKISSKKDFKAKGIGGWKENKVIDKLIKKALILDFRVGFTLSRAGIKLPGLSNYAICKKHV